MQTETPKSVTGKVARGAAWILGFKLFERSLGFVSTLILARLLVPEDFGIVAMATSLIAILEMLTAFNFEAALIQKPQPSDSDYSAAWTLNLLLGLGSAIAMVLLANPLAEFFREPRLQDVVTVLALVPLLQGTYNVWLTEFRKNLQFQQDFAFQAAKKMGGFALTIPLALWTGSYWALVAGMVGGQVVGNIASYRLHPKRPRPSLRGARALLGFSLWTLIGNALTTARVRLSHFVLGRLGGAAPLGVFAMASDITTLPTTELVMPINRAVFPAYAGMANDRDALRGAYLAVLGMVALAITPAALGLIAVAPLAVPLLLGPAWSGVIPLVAPLALFGLSLSLQTNAMSVYWAVGRPRLGAITSGLMLLALAIPIIPMTRSMGSTGTALACVISGVVTVPATFWLLARLLDLGWRDFVSHLWRPALAGLVMMLTVQAFVAGQFTGGWRPGPWVGLPLAIAIGGFVYALLIAGLWTLAGRPEGSEAFVLRRVSDTLRQRRARTEA